MSYVTIAICSYNGGHYLTSLVEALRAQEAPCPFEILVIDNNSSDDTPRIAAELSQVDGIPVRYCFEPKQGIVHARNRAIEECLHPCADTDRLQPTGSMARPSPDSRYLAFIDVDELPCPGWLATAVDALEREGADCVGGEIRIRFPALERPRWLTDSMLGFLGELKNSPDPVWIRDQSTPVWSGNIAYRLDVFAAGLRFDLRFNRAGEGIGGGEDLALFHTLLDDDTKIRYRPDMAIEHLIPESKLKRSYFLRLHYLSGVRFGRYRLGHYDRTLLGIAPFTVVQALRHLGKTVTLSLQRSPELMRQAMNTTHALGMLQGQWQRRRKT